MSDDTPWHRAYRTSNWRVPMRPLPEGRQPARLFNKAQLEQLCRSVGKPAISTEALVADLRALADDYITVALTTPLGLRDSPKDIAQSKRAQWLERRIHKPATMLADALADGNAAMGAPWPDVLDVPCPDRDELRTKLKELANYTAQLSNSLRDRSKTTPLKRTASSRHPNRKSALKRAKSRGANHTQEFKLDFAMALRAVFERHFPQTKVSRGSYAKASGEMAARFAEFIRICSRVIFPRDKELSDYIIATLVQEG